MKYDAEVFKSLLQVAQDRPASKGLFVIQIPTPLPPEVTEDQLAQIYHQLAHLKPLIEGGFLEGKIRTDHKRRVSHVIIDNITLDGQEFLSRIANDKVWNKIKSKSLEVGGLLSLEALKTLADHYWKELMTSI